LCEKINGINDVKPGGIVLWCHTIIEYLVGKVNPETHKYGKQAQIQLFLLTQSRERESVCVCVCVLVHLS